ncbi:MAG: ferrous iron transport protein A [Methanobrevibacter sp.]|nr:ferrous iron transport protein A [Methanobrevibacter sp.]
METKTLLNVKPGEEATIKSLKHDGDDDLRRHLLGMGFVKGAKIKVEKVAPLGDPIKFKIKGYSVCLRKDEAKNIEVQ